MDHQQRHGAEHLIAGLRDAQWRGVPLQLGREALTGNIGWRRARKSDSDA
jgi:hypothetical protein